MLRRGDKGVSVPGGTGVIRIPEEPSGSWRSSDGTAGMSFDIERPSAKARRVPGWPSLDEPTALLAFREDGAVYVVAQPADPARWTTCHVFDTATGYHLHTIERAPPK